MKENLKKKIEAWEFFTDHRDILEEGPGDTILFINELIAELRKTEEELANIWPTKEGLE